MQKENRVANPTFNIQGVIKDPDPCYEMFYGTPEPNCTGISQLKIFLAENSEATDLDIVINSEGGDAQMGLDIHDLLVASGKVIHSRVEGVCYSAATPSLLAARKENRSMMENSTIGIHLPYIPPYTLADSYTADELQSLADGMRVFEDLYIKLYTDSTDKTSDELRGLMVKETIMDSALAVELGFVAEVVRTNVKDLLKLKAVAFINSKQNKMENIQEKLSAWDKIMLKLDNWFAKNEKPVDPPAVEPPAITQEQLDLATAEIATLKEKITSLETALTEATARGAEVAAMKAEYDELKAAVDTFRSTYKPEARIQQQGNEKFTTFEERKAAAEAREKERNTEKK